MNGPFLIGSALVLLVLAALLYWLLDLAEGVYLGRRVVVWLYDRYAHRYDTIKRFSEPEEDWFLGQPLAYALQNVATTRVLDVATGTGRLPLALLRQPNFTGRVLALDLSRHMLRQAAAKTRPFAERLTLLWQDASQLPFPDAVFDAVTCLEALEFLPDSRAALVQMVRVLRPGGILLITNRTGPSARWLPGRVMNHQELTALLESLSLEEIRINLWQVDYDMVWARRPHRAEDADSVARLFTLPGLLRCPNCHHAPLARQSQAFYCDACQSYYPVARDGVVEMAG
jgi:ubiquinone/menaquinone biosynthesis C-methylase UbiE